MSSSLPITKRGVSEIISETSLAKRLSGKKPLRIKYGIDPTGDLLHLGHAVALLRLKELQEAGHVIIFLIGDFTARIGDPTGKNKTRIPLDEKQIKKNMASYIQQAGLLLNMKKVEVRYNSEWYGKWKASDLVSLLGTVTHAQVIQRADFQKRIEDGADIAMSETIYPILQGYDSVMLKSDVEVGGTDQKFNLLMGRQLQKHFGQEPQEVIMTELLEGLDGHDKMSKSLGNFISLTEKPEDMYGKVMSTPDTLLWKYFSLTTLLPEKDIDLLAKQAKAETLNPRDAKMKLAREIVKMYHNAKAADKAEDHFIQIFQNKSLPSDIPTHKLSSKLQQHSLPELLVELGYATSNSEARRLIEQGGIKIDDAVVKDPKHIIKISGKGILIQKGKRHFVKVVSK